MLADRFLLIPSLGWAIIFVALLQLVFKFQLYALPNDKFIIPAFAIYFFGIILVFLFLRDFLSKHEMGEYDYFGTTRYQIC